MNTFRLPRPPSVNNLFFTVGRRRVRSKQYEAWRAEAHRCIMVQRIGQSRSPIATGYRLDIVVERCRADLPNLEKAVSDALVHMGVVIDDSLCEELHMRWGAAGTGCVVAVIRCTVTMAEI